MTSDRFGLPIHDIPLREDPLLREGRTAGLQFFLAAGVGGVLSKAALDTGLRWWFLNLPVVLLIGLLGSAVGMGVARAVDLVADALGFERHRGRARFWFRYLAAFYADALGFSVASSALEGRSLWRGSSRFSWTVGWPLAAFLIAANALDAEASERVAAARGMLLSPVTGLRNRRAFDADFAELVRAGVPFTYLFADLDGLKQVNDEHGHAAGNDAIVALAKALEQQDGVAYHWGGDEFSLCIAGTDREKLVSIAEAISLGVRGFGRRRAQLLGVSIGATFVRNDDARPTPTIQKDADDALYAAKEAGRSRLAISGEPATTTL